MTTPDDKFNPQEGPLPAIPESEEEPPRGVKCGTTVFRDRDLPEPRHLNRFESRPATDWLAVLGIGSAAFAFLLWAWPGCALYNALLMCSHEAWFSLARLPAVAAFLALSFILLLLRAAAK